MVELARDGAGPALDAPRLFGPAKIHSVADLSQEPPPTTASRSTGIPSTAAVIATACSSAWRRAQDWASRKSKGRALGIAVHRSFLAYIAVVVSVVKAKGPDGKISVDEAWICADVGTVVNLERVKSARRRRHLRPLARDVRRDHGQRNGVIEQQRTSRLPPHAHQEAPRAIHVDVIPSDAPRRAWASQRPHRSPPRSRTRSSPSRAMRIRELPLVRSVPI